MNQNQNGNLLSFKTIGKIFSEIDEKILSLHQCSYDDFAVFNAQLKNFSLRLRQLYDNLLKISSLNANAAEEKKQFESLIKQFSISLDKVRNTYNIIIKDIEKYKKNTNSLSLRIKNFKQNLLTFKYLLSNLKIRLVYLNPENLSFENAGIIDEQIRKLDEFFGELEKIKKQFNTLSMGLHVGVKRNTETLQQIIQSLYEMWRRKEEYFNNLEICVNGMTGKINLASSNLGQIITQLQFQDIVRQRMEHIQQMHKEVINVTDKFETTEMNQLSGFQQAKYLIQLRDVAILQMEQLSQVNLQYQNAIEIISRTFLDIAENLTDASLLYVMTFLNGEKKIVDDESIRFSLLNSINKYKQIQANTLLSFNELESMNKAFSYFNDYYLSFKDIHNKLVKYSTDLIGEVLKTDLATNEKQNLIDYIQQLVIDNSSIAEFKLINEQNSQIQNDFVANVNKMNGFIKSIEIESLAQSILFVFDDIIFKGKNVNEIYETNDKISTTLIEEVFTAMQQVKYYDFFEGVIKEIVDELNNVYSQIINSSRRKVKPEAIDYFRKLYTMEHERIVHERVKRRFNLSALDDYTCNSGSKPDDNIEFF
ncbi:MAG: hypothetical protein ACPLXM_11210 [Bacteroidales bacterium]